MEFDWQAWGREVGTRERDQLDDPKNFEPGLYSETDENMGENSKASFGNSLGRIGNRYIQFQICSV